MHAYTILKKMLFIKKLSFIHICSHKLVQKCFSLSLFISLTLLQIPSYGRIDLYKYDLEFVLTNLKQNEIYDPTIAEKYICFDCEDSNGLRNPNSWEIKVSEFRKLVNDGRLPVILENGKEWIVNINTNRRATKVYDDCPRYEREPGDTPCRGSFDGRDDRIPLINRQSGQINHGLNGVGVFEVKKEKGFASGTATLISECHVITKATGVFTKNYASVEDYISQMEVSRKENPNNPKLNYPTFFVGEPPTSAMNIVPKINLEFAASMIPIYWEYPQKSPYEDDYDWNNDLMILRIGSNTINARDPKRLAEAKQNGIGHLTGYVNLGGGIDFKNLNQPLNIPSINLNHPADFKSPAKVLLSQFPLASMVGYPGDRVNDRYTPKLTENCHISWASDRLIRSTCQASQGNSGGLIMLGGGLNTSMQPLGLVIQSEGKSGLFEYLASVITTERVQKIKEAMQKYPCKSIY